MIIRIFLIFVVTCLCAGAAHAGALSESFVNSTITSLDVAALTAGRAITVSLWVILFYIFYLGTIWAFNISMYVTEPRLAPGRRKFAKYFCRANIFLAAGDTAMFIAFLIAYLFPQFFETPQGSQKLMQLLLLGVFSTSLTMSVYYFYVGLYLRERFALGAWNVLLVLIFVFFVARLLLHYNPENIWFSMMLPPGQPNYSSWLRNIPLFIYGLAAVIAVGYLLWHELQRRAPQFQRKANLCVLGAMAALVISFIVYAVDIFYSHRIPREWIWIVYTLKTLAYMAAFFLMWLGEFYFGQRIRETKTRRRR